MKNVLIINGIISSLLHNIPMKDQYSYSLLVLTEFLSKNEYIYSINAQPHNNNH